MRLSMSIADRDAILAAARGCAEEVCGLLLGTGDARGFAVARIVPCRNVAADPARRFEIDPAALIAAHRSARRGGAGVIGHYHSHPSGTASPSPRDAADAAVDGAVWIVATGCALGAWRAVADGAVHGRFDAMTLVTDGCAARG
jgi:proteasome lid subunit RPN8/RPN11